ncbi:MAG: hypothetical protein LW710_00160 [Burkholderiales bacterium]|jgi:hypothetical protein|uniref:hypothetical protein n=1 Tax=Limnobacter sp. TaxID=2003368 RepID=UPI00392BBC59|nr:hypothetical protein [Burkholderiales bacterium]
MALVQGLMQVDPSSLGSIGSSVDGPSQNSVAKFESLMAQAGKVGGPSDLHGMVEKIEKVHQSNFSDINKSIKEFNANPSDLSGLLKVTHMSNMSSIAIQMAGKVSAKSSESIEQIYKQQ